MASRSPASDYLGAHILDTILHAVAVLACSYVLVALLIVVYISKRWVAWVQGPFLVVMGGTLRLLQP